MKIWFFSYLVLTPCFIVYNKLWLFKILAVIFKYIFLKGRKSSSVYYTFFVGYIRSLLSNNLIIWFWQICRWLKVFSKAPPQPITPYEIIDSTNAIYIWRNFGTVRSLELYLNFLIYTSFFEVFLVIVQFGFFFFILLLI